MPELIPTDPDSLRLNIDRTRFRLKNLTEKIHDMTVALSYGSFPRKEIDDSLDQVEALRDRLASLRKLYDATIPY